MTALDGESATATWTCFSCDVVVEYGLPLIEPRFLSHSSGRTTFLMNGKEIHQCAEGKYHQPWPSLRLLQ
jgi:hypothetical protein